MNNKIPNITGPNRIICFVLYCVLTTDIKKKKNFPGLKDLVIPSFFCFSFKKYKNSDFSTLEIGAK